MSGIIANRRRRARVGRTIRELIGRPTPAVRAQPRAPGTWTWASAVALTCWLVGAVAGPLAWAAQTLTAGEPVWHAVLEVVLLAVPATVGAWLASRRPGHPVGWLLLVTATADGAGRVLARVAQLSALGSERFPGVGGAGGAGVWSAWLDAVLWAFGPPLVPLLALTFPDGRPRGRLGRWGVRAGIAGVAAVAVTSAVAPGPLAAFSSSPGPANPIGVTALAGAIPALAVVTAGLLIGAAAAGCITVVLRWREGGPSQRLALAVAGTPLLAALVLTVLAQAARIGGEPLAVVAAVLVAVGVPVGIGVGVTRYRLLGADLAITAALAWTLVVAVLGALYVAVAALVGLAVGHASPVAVALAAGTAAAAFGPLRERLTRWVRARMLGPAADPLAAAAAVAARLAAVSDPDDIPDAATAAVAEALDLRPVALRTGAEPAAPGTLAVRLVHHGASLGSLQVPAGVPSSARAALHAVAVPVAAALHAATLADAVRRSRTDLLAAVEEERRRLRRDLHDGLGPRLATVGMGLDTVANQLAGSPTEPLVAPVLGRLRDQTEGMLADVRRIVSGLRPPALDDVGLVEAIRLHAGQVTRPGELAITVAAEPLGPLPAAVEVAAYRIAIEAVLNAVRHSGGRRCTVELRRREHPGTLLTIRDGPPSQRDSPDHDDRPSGGLLLDVRDDGHGISARHDRTAAGAPVSTAAGRPPTPDAAGIGLPSMRERAAALGGWVTITSTSAQGTHVRAWLPVGAL